MFQRIVVPLDGPLRAERAIPVAARLARASGGSVVLLRVVSIATEYWPTIVSQPTMKQTAMDAELTEAETYLSEVATRPKLDHVPAALEPAASLIAAFAAPASGALHLVRVVPPVTAECGSQDGDTRSSSEQVLHKAKRYLSATVEHLHEGLTAPGVAWVRTVAAKSRPARLSPLTPVAVPVAVWLLPS